ncbi:hypothetical protein AMECASPLE_036881 [Ameca splendens]|uniref:Uncharacterized protein n=1 Tax=Ameca splendens TaxID=208324 RepID=A0ABV0Z5P0_9TELE
MSSSTCIAALTSPGIIKAAENKVSLPFCNLSHEITQRRRTSGKTKARRRTFSPQGHSWKSLKAGNLSDARSSEDLFADRRPRRHPAQVKTLSGLISKEMSFLLVGSVD